MLLGKDNEHNLKHIQKNRDILVEASFMCGVHSSSTADPSQTAEYNVSVILQWHINSIPVSELFG